MANQAEQRGNFSPRVCGLVSAWPLRTVRALAVTACTSILAFGGHLFGGGEAPSHAVVGVVVAMTFALAWAYAATQLSVRELIGMLMLGQAGVHVLCSLDSATGASTGGVAMIAAHVVSTAMATTLLAHGERLLWRVADAIGLRAVKRSIDLTAPVVASGADAARPTYAPPHALRNLQDGNSRFDRGPPQAARRLALRAA